MISGARDADGSSMPGRTIRPVTRMRLPLVPRKLLLAAVWLAAVAVHVFTAGLVVELPPANICIDMPTALVIGNPPVVGPGTVPLTKFQTPPVTACSQ